MIGKRTSTTKGSEKAGMRGHADYFVCKVDINKSGIRGEKRVGQGQSKLKHKFLVTKC